jgi:hypothetical protein
LRLDPPLEFLVQALDGVRRSYRFPLAFGEAREDEQSIARCRLRDRAMFDLAIDSKLRGCDVVKVKIGDLVSGGRVRSRAIVIQQKTGRPV